MEQYPTPKSNQQEGGRTGENIQEVWERIQTEVVLQTREGNPGVPGAVLRTSRKISERTQAVALTVGDRIQGADNSLSRFEERVGVQAVVAQEALEVQFEALRIQTGEGQSV